jgi:hypothetical protein
MKASEVTESGFYWWKAPKITGRLRMGWQPIYVEFVDGIMYGEKLGQSCFMWTRQDLESEVIGPLRTPSEDRSAALTRWSKQRLDRINALLGYSQEFDRLNKGEGNEAG